MDTIITTFFAELFDSISATLYNYCSLITMIFQSKIGLLFQVIIGFYIVFISIAGMLGVLGEKEKQLFVSVILLLFLSSFFSDSKAYIDLLKDYTEWVLDMGAFFITGGDNVETEQLFYGVKKLFEFVNLLLTTDSGGFLKGLRQAVTFWIMLFLTFGVVLSFFYALLVALLKISIYSILGPFFLFFVSFKETRSYFKNWLKGLLTESLTIIIVCVVMGICASGLSASMGAYTLTIVDDKVIFNTEYVKLMIWCFFVGGGLLSCHEIAALLVGTVGGSGAMIIAGMTAGTLSAAKMGAQAATTGGGTVATKVVKMVKKVKSKKS